MPGQRCFKTHLGPKYEERKETSLEGAKKIESLLFSRYESHFTQNTRTRCLDAHLVLGGANLLSPNVTTFQPTSRISKLCIIQVFKAPWQVCNVLPPDGTNIWSGSWTINGEFCFFYLYLINMVQFLMLH